MTEFPSLREFMLLNDCTGRSVWEGRNIRPFEIIVMYDNAKMSWERYGDAPPFGSTVMTLFPGHGGPAGMLKTLAEFFDSDARFYHLVDQDDGHWSISEVAHWWMEFQVLETAE